MMKMILIAIFALLIMALLFFRFLLSPQAEKQWNYIDFKTLKLKESPNQYLVCSKEHCSAEYQREAKIYSCSVSELKAAWENAISLLPNTRLLGEDTQLTQQVYIDYSKIWHFPDFIYVQFYELPDNRSSMAVYSYSVYGYSDFGVNKKRVEKILSSIRACHQLVFRSEN